MFCPFQKCGSKGLVTAICLSGQVQKAHWKPYAGALAHACTQRIFCWGFFFLHFLQIRNRVRVLSQKLCTALNSLGIELFHTAKRPRKPQLCFFKTSQKTSEIRLSDMRQVTLWQSFLASREFCLLQTVFEQGIEVAVCILAAPNSAADCNWEKKNCCLHLSHTKCCSSCQIFANSVAEQGFGVKLTAALEF